MYPPTPVPGTPLLPTPVLVVEDEPVFQQRILRILLQLGYEQEALCMTGTLRAARDLLAQDPVSLALIDLGLPDGSGIELISELRQDDPAVGILVISAWSTQGAILEALKAGATGYVLKEREDIEISLAIRSILRGGAPIDPFIARDLITELHPPMADGAPMDSTHAGLLSAREGQILRMIADGLANREVAGQLHISRHTVECHIKHIYRKLAVSSRTQAIHEGRTLGLLR